MYRMTPSNQSADKQPGQDGGIATGDVDDLGPAGRARHERDRRTADAECRGDGGERGLRRPAVDRRGGHPDDELAAVLAAHLRAPGTGPDPEAHPQRRCIGPVCHPPARHPLASAMTWANVSTAGESQTPGRLTITCWTPAARRARTRRTWSST